RVSQVQQQDANVVTTLLYFGLNKSLTLGNSIGHVRRTPKQSTNLATSPLAFENSKTPTLENSNG
nr:hypothetical protein [Tanacetum cinerariifolium]